MFYTILKFILSPLIKIFWLKRIEGLENIPKTGSVILASNHESYLDFFLLPAVCKRRVYFMAGEVFFKKKNWAWLVKLTGQIKVDRETKDKSAAVQQAEAVLKGGGVFAIFPEGTRSSTGLLQKAFDGVGMIALNTNTNIIPVGIIGTFENMNRFDKFPRFKKNCVIKFGQPILTEQFNDKHQLTLTVMRQISLLINEPYNYE